MEVFKMDKKLLVSLGIVVVLVVGALFVNANNAPQETTEEPTVCRTTPKTCNENTCKQECGGNCGIKSCGCS